MMPDEHGAYTRLLAAALWCMMVQQLLLLDRFILDLPRCLIVDGFSVCCNIARTLLQSSINAGIKRRL